MAQQNSYSPKTAPRLLAVVGATASGKTALSIALAQALGGEIISFDSMQVYRGMDVGTATPTAQEQAAAVHHLINTHAPEQRYSCADFVTAAEQVIGQLAERGVTPVLCGGTGLYLDGLLCGNSYDSAPAGDAALRERLLSVAEREGAEALWARLRQVDPESAQAIHPNNVKRVVRALEIYELSGKTKSAWDRESRQGALRYPATVVGLRYRRRELLYARIDRRVDAMLADGLLQEVQTLYARGVFDRSPTAAQAIGYKELFGVLRGEQSLAEAQEQLKGATRRYAKRQMTWFQSRDYVQWIDADDADGALRSPEELLAEALRLWQRDGGCCDA